MMNGKKVFRLVISSFLLVAIIATCVGVYQSSTKSGGDDAKKLAEGTPLQEDNLATNDEQNTTEDETTDVGTNSVEGTKETEENQNTAPEQETAPSADTAQEAAPEAASNDVVSDQAEAPAAPVIDFTEESLMEWPINGEIVLDYSMDHTIYFPTLDVYKYNPSIVIKSEVNTPVNAVANGQVVSVTNSAETGTTITMDMGNGYQAMYGQLKEVAFEEGATVEAGTVIGYVSEPTKYFSKEGSNLYFEMTKDGNPLDPMMYLP